MTLLQVHFIMQVDTSFIGSFHWASYDQCFVGSSIGSFHYASRHFFYRLISFGQVMTNIVCSFHWASYDTSMPYASTYINGLSSQIYPTLTENQIELSGYTFRCIAQLCISCLFFLICYFMYMLLCAIVHATLCMFVLVCATIHFICLFCIVLLYFFFLSTVKCLDLLAVFKP